MCPLWAVAVSMASVPKTRVGKAFPVLRRLQNIQNVSRETFFPHCLIFRRLRAFRQAKIIFKSDGK
jgi:hypothetical protein